MKFTTEKLQETILESFASLGFKPRGFQPEVIFTIVNAFLNKGKQNVVCSLDTGAGKSIIGAVVADVVSKLTPEDECAASIITMGQNSLATQYLATFSDQEDYKYFQIKGAANYSCRFMESQPSATSRTAEECVSSKLLDIEKSKYCGGCEYDHARKMIHKTDNLITNNSYFFISQFANLIKQRKMHVFDEAHNLNEAYCNHTGVTVAADLLDKYIKELGDANGKCDNNIAELILIRDALTSKKINLDNYKEYLEKLDKEYSSISNILGDQAKGLETVDVVKSVKYEKLANKYKRNSTLIRDMMSSEYDNIFDDSTPNTFTVKTVFIGGAIEPLLAKYNLFMSATITQTFIYDILQLDKNLTEFIETPPVFPAENKPIFFIGKIGLNYNALKDPDTIQDLKNQVSLITNFHSEDSGLVIVPSFYLGSTLARGIRSHKVFEHKQGMNISDLISEFKCYNKPSVLVSPSIFEGLDFAGDHSRFQIIVKSPYPSLADRRIKHIADHYPTIYQEMTLTKIIQGIGRSIRSHDDHAVTYCLDKSTEKLFSSRLNIWKNRFTVQQKGS